ncbi:hypothetical protein BU24DRAFT_351435 [Aaosphaeria arxii CBS 175.79]|uniref:DRBM domain-containing protein n=1 Tax=Aaosphaeria arxii CBS 175.79 TaxID=1450172 RepID=A0A6A5XJX4_9PLEO|nr:uncharacterized protein BU24DRAFT_351435 [Aaosphaeria arxii CBS 175.79]KAF2013040.1 hypothetical protein BU24DRAFT_351435 [Aaosphaeria arxii CBS 175.79]
MAAQDTWSQRLRDHCTIRGIGDPSWQEISDRRGGRTAWSSVCQINGSQYQARFWYDGTFADQAREDAAEVALRALTGTVSRATDPPPASYYARA